MCQFTATRAREGLAVTPIVCQCPRVALQIGQYARRRTSAMAAASLVPCAIAAGTGCGAPKQNDFGGSTGGAPDSSLPDDAGSSTFSSAGDSGGGGSFGGANATRYNDFAKPVFDGTGAAAPASSPTLFGPMSQGARSGGPCITEPGNNALFPRNWLRPLFRWNAPSGENLFELRVHAPNQDSDLVVYTVATSWTMPKALWDLLRNDSNDVQMSLSIRGGTLNGGQLTNEAQGSLQAMGVAPADAPGAIVYWTSSEGTTLKGFQVGDETVGTTLLTTQVQQVTLGSGQCMGCHNGTPDGEYSVLSGNANNWGDFVALIDPSAGAVGSAPPFLGAGAKATLAQGPLGMNAVSKGHWANGDHVVLGSDDTDIVWVDLEATDPNSARGAIARTGGPANRVAAAPAWSHDGSTIVYVSTAFATGGRPGGANSTVSQLDPGSAADLYRVSYNARKGGAVSPVAGASDPNKQEFYPAFSPDDAYIAFNECPDDLSMYNQAQSEIYVVPSKGGTATRLAANSPTSCSGIASPGITNSWAKWAPAITQTPDGRSFYWVVFSSKRFGTTPQLFVSAMKVDAKGSLTTYGGLYLWNQPSTEGNHTPAWEYFNIPPATPK